MHLDKVFIILWMFSISAQAEMNHSQTGEAMRPSDCNEMMIWDYHTSNCKPLPMKDMPMKMWMVHGNAFFVQPFLEGERGRNQFSIPNMLMGDFGSSLGDRHYLNLNLMLTFEKWTFPARGYPELFQIGEKDAQEKPYIDSQHPHSSPIMGATLSDTIRLDHSKDHIKFFFSPRGQATEGPVVFMHRRTGMVNPDAPLGHHVGQDVAHISSTVLGASIGLSKFRYEISLFNGTEPEPTKSDVPLGKINSYAARWIYEVDNSFYAMASASTIKNPEPHDPTLNKIHRYSTSFYNDYKFSNEWMFHNSFIFGLVNSYDHISKLRSFNEEFYIHSTDLPHNFWGRLEVLERGAEQLKISSLSDVLWIEALTLGYTYDLWKEDSITIGIGTSLTKNFIPKAFEDDYGQDPTSGKIFIQILGMKMGNF